MEVMTLVILLVVACLDAFVLVKLVRGFRTLKLPDVAATKGADLPTVTICITARNETHAMTQCLERVVASDYPKLEIIVLDDGSRDDTSLLIKSFAHAGVRFIEGKPLPDGWLGKNYAQLTLAREASGKLVFFMDVDTMVERHSVERAVAVMMARGDTMLSIMPQRRDAWQANLLFTTMRYFWILMRYSPRSPRATASAWLVERDLLIAEFDRNESLAQSMKVETALAVKLTEANGFHLVTSTPWLGLTYDKGWSAQIETSIRILYLQCGRRWYKAALLALLLVMTLVPYTLVFVSPAAWVLVAAQFVVAAYYLSHVGPRYRIVGALLLPVTIVQEIILLIISVYRYATGTVTWKGRPIVRTIK